MLQHELRNHKLFAWLDRFRTLNWDKCEANFGGDNHDLEDESQNEDTTSIPTENRSITLVTEWIEAQWSASLKDIREPIKEDFPILSRLARDNGGLEYMSDRCVS